jgi:uncharacterized protein (UPF0335 family)
MAFMSHPIFEEEEPVATIGDNSKKAAQPVQAAEPEDVLSKPAQSRLRTIFERLERLQTDKEAIQADMKQVFMEAKGEGFDVKTLKKVQRILKMTKAKYSEEQAMIDLYLSAIGEA